MTNVFEPQVAVIVPAMQRPQNAARLMSSLRATSDHATAYFICDSDDTAEIEAASQAGARVVINPSPIRTFAVKANLGYTRSTEPWLLFVGDDVEFQPGWREAALSAASNRYCLVSTNDGNNPAVMAGQHATHPMVLRTWLDWHGATWDGPGRVAHEGYHHWFVDNEWTQVAQRMGAFVYAPDSVVSHHHPVWGTGEDDCVYQVGQRWADTDAETWRTRLAHHGDGPWPIWSGRLDQAPGFDLAASVAAYGRQWSTDTPVTELGEDLDRYRQIIDRGHPELVVLGGWDDGQLSAWFAGHGCEVLWIDEIARATTAGDRDGLRVISGSPDDDWVRRQARAITDGHRTMVVLCAGERASARRVSADLEALAPLVSPGCHLVAEDGICRYVAGTPISGSGPLDALEAFLPAAGWRRDLDVEQSHPITHHPCGWLLRE